MATAQRTPDMTPAEYGAWWQRASDAEIEGWPHPEDYAADWEAKHPPRQPEAARSPFRGGNPPRFARAGQAQPRQPQAPARGQERQAQEAPAKTKTSMLVGVFAAIIGVPLWFEAARFTRDGWIRGVNWLAARLLSVEWQVPAFDWRVMAALAVLIGIAYSRVEFRPPVRPPKNWRKDFWQFNKWTIERAWQVWAVWIFLILTDVASTYAGAQLRGRDANEVRLLREIAAHSGALVTYAILLTFLPDGLIRYGWRTLRRK